MTDPLRAETKRLLALAYAATPGPWYVGIASDLKGGIGIHTAASLRDRVIADLRADCSLEQSANADLIAAAHDMAAHLRALQAENDRLQGDLKHLREVRDPGGCECSDDDACMFARQRDAFKAECEALRVDVGRYRWLRNPSQDVGLVLDKRVGETDYGHLVLEYRAGEELDTAIDAAMNREREPCA